MKETEFDIRFNPDVLSPGVRHPVGKADAEKLKKEKELVKDAADFLITVQIPTFIRDCLDHSAAPLDGVTLVEAIHSRGKIFALIMITRLYKLFLFSFVGLQELMFAIWER